MSASQVRDKRQARRTIGLIAGTALSLLSLALVVRGVAWGEVARTLARTSPLHVALAILSYAASVWAKAERWRLLFYPRHRQMRLGKLASIYLIGSMANVWLLSHAGELARAYLVGRIERTNTAGALGTLVLERAFESVVLLASLGLLGLFMPLPGWLQTSSLLLSGLLAVVLAALLLAAYQRERTIAWGEALARRAPWLNRWRISERLIAVSRGLEGLGRLDVDAGLLGWSLLAWVIAALTNLFALRAVGIHLPWYAPLFLLVVFSIGAVVPASPGRLGVFHYLTVQSLAFFGVAREPALGFAIVLHLVVYALPGLAGAICLWRENYALQRAQGGEP